MSSALAPAPVPVSAPETWPEMLARVAREGGRLLVTPQLAPCGTAWFLVEELAPHRPRVSDFVVIDGGGVAPLGSNR